MIGNWFAPTRQQLAPHRLRLNHSVMQKISPSSNSPLSNTSRNSQSVPIEPLDRMWNPRREIPQIADTYVVDEVSLLRVDGRDARGPIERGSNRPVPAAYWRRRRKSVSSAMRRGRSRAPSWPDARGLDLSGLRAALSSDPDDDHGGAAGRRPADAPSLAFEHDRHILALHLRGRYRHRLRN
jgi:hypothetical protein